MPFDFSCIRGQCSSLVAHWFWVPGDLGSNLRGGGETFTFFVLGPVITLWYVHVPRTDRNRPRYMHLAIAIDIEVLAHT